MSRCFPFPPRGYEKKLRPDENLLKEEKHKEKKQKKDKKDKEKREGKDKKKSDKSEDRHKVKKDRKDKHRDKKHRDKKDKSKDKEKSSISEDASITGQPETKSGGKLHSGEENHKAKGHGSDEKKFTTQFQGQNGQNPIANRLLASETEESKFVQELGRRIRDEGKAMGSKSVERFPGLDFRENQGTQFPVGDPRNLAEGKGRNKGQVDDRKVVEGRDEAGFGANTMVQKLVESAEHKVGGAPVPVQNDVEKSIDGKDKYKGKGDHKQGEKRKDKEKKDKKSHGKNKGKEKDKKKEEKAKEKTEHRNHDQDRSKELYRDEFTSFSNNNSSHLPVDNNKHIAAGQNQKKRKDVEANGFIHVNDVRPSKFSRSTSRQLRENGRILEASQAPGLVASDNPGVASQHRIDNKECWVNGMIEAPSLSVLNRKPPLAVTRPDQLMEVPKKPLPVDQVVEAPKRLPQSSPVTGVSKKHSQADQIPEPSKKPHPDLKYLKQVLSVPKMDEWSEVDDQEWLFSSKGPPSKKPEAGSRGDNTEPEVWSEAVHLESADIYALPYVIPY